MKKLFLLAALCLPLTVSGQSSLKGDYSLRGVVSGDNPKAYLFYKGENGHVIDSVNIVNHKFEFNGTTQIPFIASLYLNYDPKTFYSDDSKDYIQFYIEPGIIDIVVEDQLKDAKFSGSRIYDDMTKWGSVMQPLGEEMNREIELYNNLPEAEHTETAYNDLVKKGSEIKKKQLDLGAEFIRENPGSWFAFEQILPGLVVNVESKKAQELLDLFDDEFKATPKGTEIQAMINLNKEVVSIGNAAPDFTQNDPDGNPVKLSDFRGQWVLLDFWASWCGPCRQENPNVVNAYRKFKDKGFTVLGVSLDGTKQDDKGRRNWLDAIKTDKLTWTHVSDLAGWDNSAAVLYGVKSIPANFLINPEGMIVGKNLRGETLIKALEEYIK